MAKQVIDVGTSASDGTGDPLRTAFTKINENFTELYSGNVQVTAANIRVFSVNGRVGNVNLSVNDIVNAASVGYVNNAISANLANINGATIDTINANITAANSVISNHSASITTLESNSAAQAVQINSLVSVKANVSYVDSSISSALSNSAIAACVSVINANVTAANLAISNLESNAATQGASLLTLLSNSATQATQINLVNSNITAANASISSLTSNAASQSQDITALQGNTGILAASINALTSNSSAQSIQIDLLNANVTASNLLITNLQSNAVSQQLSIQSLESDVLSNTSNIGVLTANAATQATQINSLNANVTAANAKISTNTSEINSINANVTAANVLISELVGNAAQQATTLTTLVSNASSQGDSIVVLLSNSATQATQINLINANVTAANVEISSLIANAALQATYITNVTANIAPINANMTAANTNISTLFTLSTLGNLEFGNINTNIVSLTNSTTNSLNQKANISGQTFTGNIETPYLLTSSNVIIDGILEIGESPAVNYPGKAAIFVGNVDSYYQLVIQNKSSGNDASGDLVITSDDGNDGSNYLNVGINSSNFVGNIGETNLTSFPHDGYIFVEGGNVALASTESAFITAGNAFVALIKDGNFNLLGANLQFSDGTTQSSAIEDIPALYANIGQITNDIIGTNAAIVTANVGMKAYVDYQVSLNTTTGNVIFSDTTISTQGGTTYGIILDSAGNGEIAMLDYVGVNNTNPGYWMHIGDGSVSSINNTGNISIDYSNGLGTSRGSVIIDYAWWDAGSNGNDNRGIGAHSHFGIYKNDDTHSQKFIEFEYSSGNVTVGNLTVSGNTAYTMGNASNWTSPVSTVAAALDQIAARLKALNG
jgi:septal ring factor EnvC (AmiA/AmiB activator)